MKLVPATAVEWKPSGIIGDEIMCFRTTVWQQQSGLSWLVYQEDRQSDGNCAIGKAFVTYHTVCFFSSAFTVGETILMLSTSSLLSTASLLSLFRMVGILRMLFSIPFPRIHIRNNLRVLTQHHLSSFILLLDKQSCFPSQSYFLFSKWLTLYVCFSAYFFLK